MERCWSSCFLRLWLICTWCTEFLMQTCRKSYLGLSLVFFFVAVLAGAGLLQCLYSDILRIMIDGDIICIRDIFMILQTQYFDICLREWPSCCIAAWLTGVILVIIILEIMADMYWFFLCRNLGNHLWSFYLWLCCCWSLLLQGCCSSGAVISWKLW